MMRNTREAGFTMMEVICAIVILSLGLMGTAMMQTTAVQGSSFAMSFVEGNKDAEEWMEWLMDYVNRSDQDETSCNGFINRENYCTISSLDANTADANYTETAIPATTAALLTLLGNKGFRNAQGGMYTAEAVPEASPPGQAVVWRIAANYPVEDVTTVEIRTTSNNAFARNKRSTLRFVISSNM